jgi:multidrug efflux pump subunit AcrA (membrane-fusion protein)
MLTASHLYQYMSCPRWTWNELHGDPKRKRGPSAFLKKLLADGIQHEESIYAALQPARVPWTGDHAVGEAETRRLMAAGAPLIAQAVLRSADGRIGIVDLLEQVPGRSALGDYTYEPVEIKTARAIKSVYKLQLAFYGDLLCDVLGAWPERAHVVLVDGSVYPFIGRMTFAEPSYNTQTGTFLVRATVNNPEGILRPNQYVRARLKGAIRPQAILVPQRAVQQGSRGNFVWVVGPGDKVEQRPVAVGDWLGDDWFIFEGLHRGERVVVDGGLTLHPGTVVSTKPARPGAATAGAAPGPR